MAGCTTATTDVWKKPTYNETISQFLITANGEKLIFIGEKYHYIFANQDSLNNILQWPDRKLLKAAFFNNFSVDAKNKIIGRFAIVCFCHDASKKQIQWLENNEFHRFNKNNLTSTDDKGTYIKEIKIAGDRYLSNNLSLDKYDKLNNEYQIQVETDYTFLDTAGRVALTPIAVAEDGLATFMLIPIVVIGIPFYAIESVFPPKGSQGGK
jgi:hypothetical protein